MVVPGPAHMSVPMKCIYIILGVWLLGCIGGCIDPARAQSTKSALHTTVSVGGFASTGVQAPFWLMANQYGTTPSGSVANVYRFRVFMPFAPDDTSQTATKKNWGYTFALEPILNIGSGKPQGVLPEAEFSLRYRKAILSVGRSKNPIGLQDSTLSSGSIIHGPNALPMPRLLVSTKGFSVLPFWNDMLALNGGIGMGVNNGTYIKKSYYHQKYLFLRLGRDDKAIQLYMGAHHEAIWGGQAEYLLSRPDLAKDGKLPSSLKYWNNILLGTRPRQSADLAPFDQDYRIGNHVGTYQLALSWSLPKGKWLLYHQHPFEDVSGAALQNLPDGLYGLSWKPRTASRLKNMVVEYLTTNSQSGSSFLKPNSIFQGNDNYFNHSQYQEGWSYRGRGIGTPFILPGHQLREELVQGRPFYFPNNRVQVFYVAAEAQISSRLMLQTKVSHTRNKGTFDYPFDKVIGQTSWVVSGDALISPRQMIYAKAALALDRGKLLPTNTGLHISVYKTFQF